MSRLENVAKTEDKLFIPFIMAGDPTPAATVDIALALQESGASILEVGVPYSDPLADGPVIQQAAIRAIENGMTLQKAIELVGEMRAKGLTIPTIIFSYYNPVLQLGEEELFSLLKENDVDGLLIPDLPFEESSEIGKRCEEEGMALISLVAPTSQERIEKIATSAQGFLYCVSSLGVTGMRKQLDSNVYDFLQKVKEYSNVPVAVGFGISNAEQIKVLSPYCDGVIVGSALVRKIETEAMNLVNEKNKEKALSSIKTFVHSLISS